jgi:sodium/proline symporter
MEYLKVSSKSSPASVAGAIAGMVSGAGMVFLWKLVISKLGGVFAIYELLPAFLFSTVCIVIVSLMTKAPCAEIEADFEAVRSGNVSEI